MKKKKGLLILKEGEIFGHEELSKYRQINLPNKNNEENKNF